MAQAVAQARSRKERPQTLGGTVEAIDEDPLDLVRRLLLRRSALKLAIGLREGNRTRLRGISQMPEHSATDNRRQIHLFSETATVLLVGQEIRGQGETTPGEHRDQTLVAKGTD
jgi:hypothetical protein